MQWLVSIAWYKRVIGVALNLNMREWTHDALLFFVGLQCGKSADGVTRTIDYGLQCDEEMIKTQMLRGTRVAKSSCFEPGFPIARAGFSGQQSCI